MDITGDNIFNLLTKRCVTVNDMAHIKPFLFVFALLCIYSGNVFFSKALGTYNYRVLHKQWLTDYYIITMTINHTLHIDL